MLASTILMVVFITGIALFVHSRIPAYRLACCVAGLVSIVPALLVFQLAGMASLQFMPFGLFVLSTNGMLICALAGLPALYLRRRAGIPAMRVQLPWRIAPAMLGGMICAMAAVRALDMLVHAGSTYAGLGGLEYLTLVLFRDIPCASIAALVFLQARALGGGTPVTGNRGLFMQGLMLAMLIALPLTLAPYLFPQEWPRDGGDFRFAVQANLVLMLPFLAGMLWSWIDRRPPQRPRWSSHAV